MIFLLLEILKKFDYNINKNNIKQVLKILQQQQNELNEKDAQKMQNYLIEMFADIDKQRKIEEYERLANARDRSDV